MSKRKRIKAKPSAPSEADDDEVMFWFGNHLMSYFGDDGDDAGIVAHLRALFPDYPFVERNFRRGLDIAIALPARDRKRLVQHFANRRAETGDEALAWLRQLRDALFGA
jgi:hypothetical protein